MPRFAHAWLYVFPWLVGLATAPAGAQQPAARPLLTTANEFWAMPSAEKANVYPIRMEVTVGYYDPFWHLLWVQSGGALKYIPCADGLPIASGQRIRIEGTVQPLHGLSSRTATFTILAENQWIEPAVTAGQIDNLARFDTHMVTVEGYLNELTPEDDNHLKFDLIVDGHEVIARIPQAHPHLPAIANDSLVRVRGVYIAKRDTAGNVSWIDLWVPDEADLEVIGNVDRDSRFGSPVTPIDRLTNLPENKLVHVAGKVWRQEAGRQVTVRDATGQIQVQSLQVRPLPVGTRVEAIGYPVVHGVAWTLARGLFRVVPDNSSVSALVDAPRSGPLRLIDELMELGRDESARGHPVRFSMIVTWSDPQADFFFGTDSSGAVLVRRGDLNEPAPTVGGCFNVEGVSIAGDYAPAVKATHLERTNTIAIPEARPVTLEQALSGAETSQRIELKGCVRAIVAEKPWSRLEVTTTSGSFVVCLPQDPALDTLPGAIVRAQGVCEAVANERGQIVGVRLWALIATDIKVDVPAPADPFAVPERTIGGLRQFNALPAFDRWVRVKGIVTQQVPGRYVTIEQGTEGLTILTSATMAVSPGDEIEVAGLPGRESRRIMLREAVYRRTGRRQELPPAPVANPAIVDEELDSRLVHVPATLLNAVAQGSEVRLALRAGPAVFDALLDSVAGSPTPDWLPQTMLDLTGVYRIQYDERSRPRGFVLQLRSPADVRVVARPSWWTVRRALGAAGLLALIAALGLERTISLRRRVRRQTHQIRNQLTKEAQLEARFREIVENASDFIFTTDGDGRFTSFNPAGERITGYRQEDALRMNLRELIAAEDADRLPALFAPAASDQTVRFETRFQTRDGRLIWVETSSRVLHEAGRVTGLLGVVRDVSERKQIEEELKRARDAAEANTQAKSAFLANMSHEVRTPMNGVIGMSNLLLDTPLREDQHEFATTIRDSAEALLTVLNDILDFSKIEAGKMEFETIDFDLAETVEGTVELLAARAASKRLALAAFVDHDLPRHLRGDSGRLRQVLLNLLSNAVKFTEKGEVTVTITRETESDGEVGLRFEVADSGIGLTPEAQQRLFQPFMQADGTMARRFGGTGLGLAISRQIVELLHGRIGVRSTPGMGSTFWFTMAFARQPVGATMTSIGGLAALRGKRVLSVDDVPTNRRLIHHYLAPANVRLDSVACGYRAYEAVRESVEAGEPYDLILLDCQMAEFDGLAFARTLQEDARLRGPRVILLTSLDHRESPAELAAHGIVAKITKPVRQGDLFATIARVLDPASGARKTRIAPPSQDLRLPNAANLRIIIAEDNSVNQRLVRLQLKKLGCDAELAANGLEVLEALELHDYDVVLMDCQMPEMDGFEATRRIRSNGRHAGTRIIAMTAHAMQGDRERCLAAGMDDYLSKPTRLDELHAALFRATQPDRVESDVPS